MHTADSVRAAVATVSLNENHNLHSLEVVTGTSRSTLGRHVAAKTLLRVTTSVLPYLDDDHKKKRLQFSLSLAR